jgi:hypothetical protein
MSGAWRVEQERERVRKEGREGKVKWDMCDY